MIKNQVAREFQSKSNSSANNNKQGKETDIPLITIYHPRLKDISSLIKKNLQHLYTDQKVKKVFTPTPFVSFRTAMNLNIFLVRSKVYPLDRKVSSEKSNRKRCLVCLNVAETDTFKSFHTKKQYKINHNFNCNNKCLIYLLSRKICSLQHVGSTTDPFRYRWNNYKDSNRKAERGVEHMQVDLSEHFASHGHNGVLEDCIITIIDKTNGTDPTRREEYWRRVLKTVSILWVEYCCLGVPYSCPVIIHFSKKKVLLM